MIWTLVHKELLTNLLTYRLMVALIFTVALSALTTVIGSMDYSRNMEAYHQESRDQREELDKATVYQQVQPRILLPPQPLAIFSRGVVGLAPQSYGISLDYYSRAPWPAGINSDSGYMKSLGQIDFTMVVTLLLSFLAVVLGFDGICGERERGTLKQLLTNPISRAQVVLAKLLGGIISLWVPFTIAFVSCLLIVLANDDVVFSADDWVRLGILFLLTSFFLAQVFALSLMVSAFVRDSDTALIICLFAWLVGGVGYISALPSFSRYGYEETPHQNYMNQNRALWDEFSQQMNEWEEKNPPPSEGHFKGIERDGYRRYFHPAAYQWWQQRTAVQADKVMEVADRSYKARYSAWDPLAQEAYLVDRWSALSPFTNYQVLAYQLARTTLEDLFRMGRAGREYRQTYIDYLHSKKAFSSRRWFTDDPPDQEPMVVDPESMTAASLSPDSPFMLQRMGWAQEQEKNVDANNRRLDLGDLPKFDGQWQGPLAATFAAMMPGLVVLLLSLGTGVFVAVMRFQRYDPQ
ncbi:MAG: ABC transporter permease subunit [Candidatus Latescibacteria bacterium]|nr:ABC transporter permease subunit [Candidatus Latescibacterota bacterium]